MLRYIAITAITLLVLLLFLPQSFGGERRVPDNFRTDSDNVCNNGMLSTSSFVGVSRDIYGLISRVDGERCLMHPTCSHYSVEAIEKHGILVGIVMTFDRLIHESNETDYAPLVEVGDSVRYDDPVENNDYWWSD